MLITSFDKTIFYCILLYALASSISIAAANIAVSLASLLAIIRYAMKPFPFRVDKGVAVVIVFFISTMLISALFADRSDIAFNRLWTYIYRTLPLLLAACFITTRKQFTGILITMAASIFFADCYAIWQGIHGSYRVSAFSSHPMILAGYLIQMIPLVIAVAIDGKDISPRVRAALGVIAVVSLLAAVFNGTRGAWISIVFVLFLFGLLKVRVNYRVTLFLVFFIIVLLAGILIIPGGYERLASIVDLAANSERLLLWQSAWRMFLDHPLVGVGLGAFGQVYQESYISPLAQEQLGHAHNNFLHILADTGILGFIGFMAMFVYILHFLWQKHCRESNYFALGVFLATLALLLQGVTEFNFGDSAVIRMYWFLLGLAMAEGARPVLRLSR